MSAPQQMMARPQSSQNLMQRQNLGLDDPQIRTMVRDSRDRGSHLVDIRSNVKWETTNWMGLLKNDVSVSWLSVPGSHESCSRYGGPWVECQTLDIASQLAYGARFLDIRCRVVGPSNDRSFAIHHDAWYQHLMFGDVLCQCAAFLAENSSETIFIRVRQEYSEASNAEFKDIFYHRYLSRLFYMDSRVPNLGEVRGKIILLGDVAGLGGINYGGSDLVIQDDWKVTDYNGKLQKIYAAADASISRRFGDDRIYVNYVSGTNPPWTTPKGISHIQDPVRSFLSSNFDQYHRMGPLGIMPLDYFQSFGWWDVALVFDIITWNEAMRA